jgi:PAS domain-containing protein
LKPLALLDLEARPSGLLAFLRGAGLEILPVSSPDSLPPFADLVLLGCGSRVSLATDQLRRLRQNPGVRGVIALLNDDAFDAAPRLLALGARDCIRLPAHPADLRLRVQAHELTLFHDVAALPFPEPTQAPSSGLQDALLASCPLAVISCDDQGAFRALNAVAERLLGCPGPLARARYRVSDFLVHPQDLDRILVSLAASAPEAVLQLDVPIRNLSGEVIPARQHVVALKGEHGAHDGFLLFVSDLRERVERERAMERTTRQVLDLQRRLGAIQEIERLTVELKQPLTVVMGILELLIEGEDLADPTRTRLNRAYAQLSRLSDMVKGFSRIPTWDKSGFAPRGESGSTDPNER